MPADVPDWSSHDQSFKRALYPDGTVGASPPTPSFTVAAAATFNGNFTLPDGTSQVRFMATAGGLLFTYSLLITGVQTGEQYWGDPNLPGTPLRPSTPTLPFTVAMDREWDSKIAVQVNGDPTSASTYFVSALFVPEAPGQAGDSQQVSEPRSAPGQVAQSSVSILVNIAGGAAAVIVPAVAGQRVYRHGYSIGSDGANAVGRMDFEDTTGVQLGTFAMNATRQQYATGTYSGAPTAVGTGVQVRNAAAAASFATGYLAFTQAI